jgi:hypothetical protein
MLLFARSLPDQVQRAAETAVAALIVYLALRLLARWRRGELHFHDHPQAHRAAGHRSRPSASGSSTAWAAAPAWACCSSRPVRRGFERLAPVLGIASLAFGVWYASAAWALPGGSPSRRTIGSHGDRRARP